MAELTRARSSSFGVAAAVAVAACALLYLSDPTVEPSAFPSSASVQLRPGLRAELVVRGLELPTAFAFAPDGRIFVAEKEGRVRVADGGVLAERPVIDISDRVNAFNERGLLGIALDPAFSRNGHLYLLYSFENDASDFEGSKTARLSRFTVRGGVARLESEHVVLGASAGRSCDEFAPGSDCIPQDWKTHGVGELGFSPDGSLFVALGDAAPWEYSNERAFRAQELDSLAGKLLRITPDGEGVPTNPFWNGDPQALRSKVWAYGLRNPFRFTLGPSGVPIVGDVGWNTAEELSQARRGANLGWPCYEGAGRTPGYDEYERCQELYAGGTSAVEPPLVSIPHAEGASAIVAGDFLVGDGYDADLRGAYVFANFNTGRVQYVHLRAGRRASEVEELGTAEALVDVQRGTDGALYCLSLAGELWRIVPD